MRMTMLALMAGASLLTTGACADTVRLSGWSGSEVAIVNGLLTDVLADELKAADIQPQYEPVDGDFAKFIVNGLSAGTAPDLFYTDIFWARSIFGAGQADPVAQDVSEFDPSLISAFTYDDMVMSIPKDFNTLALHFDKDVFDEAGVAYPDNNDTWDTFQDKLVAVHTALPDVNGFCVVPDYARFAEFALATGWQVFDADGKTVLDDNFRRAFEFYTGMVQTGAAVAAADVGQGWTGGCLVNGKSAVAIEGAWILGAIRDSAPNMSFGTVCLPKDPVTGMRGNLIFTVGWTVNAASSVKPAAHKLAELLTSAKAQQWVLEQGLALPSRKSLSENAWIMGDAPEQVTNRIVYEGLTDDYVDPYFFGDLGGAWMEPVNAALNAVIVGEKDVDTALADAQARLDELMAK